MMMRSFIRAQPASILPRRPETPLLMRKSGNVEGGITLPAVPNSIRVLENDERRMGL